MPSNRNLPVTKNGEEIILRTTTDHIIYEEFPTNINLTTAIENLENLINTISGELDVAKIVIDDEPYQPGKEYKRNTIITYNGQTFIAVNNTSSKPINSNPMGTPTGWIPLSRRRHPICLLRNKYNPVDKTHTIESEYGYDFEIISNLLSDNSYSGYIQNGDYMILETSDFIFKFIVNIDVYMNLDINTINRPHCIDLICNEIEFQPNSNQAVLPEVQLPYFTENPNILTDSPSPIILSKYIINHFINIDLNDTPYLQFGENFNSHIVPKYKMVPRVLFDKNQPTSDTNKYLYDVEYMLLGHKWMLYEFEIFGKNIYSSTDDAMLCSQYPMFKNPDNTIMLYNNRRVGVLTSSLVNGSLFCPVVITKHRYPYYFTPKTLPDRGYYPMFGMRFV